MKKWLWVFLASIALLCAAFWTLNFRIAASNTKSEKNINMASIGDELPHAMQRREKINLVLVGDSPLMAALQTTLERKMKEARIANLELAQGSEPRYQNPVLIVEIGRPDLVWTPFFATSHFTVQTGYLSIGDTNFTGQTPVIMDNREGSALNMWGEYKVSDRSWGLISRPGYHQLLAEHLAQQIITTLKDLYRV